MTSAKPLLPLAGLWLSSLACAHAAPVQGGLPPKAELTEAQRKIDSNLLRAITKKDARSGVSVDARQRALVDVRAKVTPALSQHIKDLKGTIVSAVAEHDSTTAWVPFDKLEQLASRADVKFVAPVVRPMIR